MAKLRNSQGQFVSNGHQRVMGLNEPMDAIGAKRFSDAIENITSSRKELMSRFLDPRRNIDDECGYPRTDSIDIEQYRLLWEREPIAARVVNVLPDESWQVEPTVFETEDVDNITPFEEAWKDLGKNLRGDSWYQDEEGNPLWEHLRRADALSGVGHFGVLLLGLDDGKNLEEPVNFITPSKPDSEDVDPTDGKPTDTKPTAKPTNNEHKGPKLIFLRAFDEYLVTVKTVEDDISDPRFGQPTMYTITFSDPRSLERSGETASSVTKDVHWTRVIHLADNLTSSEIFGVPRMQTTYNRLYDLRKLYGGSAEMYWRGAFPGLSIETHPQLGGDVAIDRAEFKDNMENYMNGLQRYLALMGMTAKSLAPQVVDPTPQINVQIEAICIVIGVPKRVFMGSERGELASTQDDSTWNDRLRSRQNMHITPRIIIPFVDRLILIGVLPEPEGYSVVWPDLESLSDSDKATISVAKTEAMAKYVQGSVESLITPMDYLVRIHGFTQDEAIAILEAAVAEMEVKEEEEEARAIEFDVNPVTGMPNEVPEIQVKE